MDYLGYCYGLVLALGGIMGYIKAGSVMSLVMGLLTGMLHKVWEISEPIQDPK